MLKKLFATFLSISLLIGNSVISYSAEEAKIAGLEKQFDEILLNSELNSDVKEKIQASYSSVLEKKIDVIMQNPDYAKEKMGIKLGDDEYEREQLRSMFALDFENGVLISMMNTVYYSAQYTESDCFSYLFENDKLFKVPGKVFGYGDGEFSIDGEYLTGDKLSNIYDSSNMVIIDEEVISYLKNHDSLESELIKKGETNVYDISLFGIGYLTFLYIQGENDEYLIKLRDSDVMPLIEQYVLYSANDVMMAFDNTEIKNSPNSQTLAKKILSVKPVYETEAQKLQSVGLLYGNENGLDLLKPLTRIEAATMLLRALGKSTTAETTVQTFSDVPITHWGYGAAENAYSLGLIKGIGEDMFAPDDMVTGPQFATMVLRAGNHTDFNWEDALNILVNEGIVSTENIATMDFFTRGDMAKIIYEAIEKGVF